MGDEPIICVRDGNTMVCGVGEAMGNDLGWVPNVTLEVCDFGSLSRSNERVFDRACD